MYLYNIECKGEFISFADDTVILSGNNWTETFEKAEYTLNEPKHWTIYT